MTRRYFTSPNSPPRPHQPHRDLWWGPIDPTHRVPLSTALVTWAAPWEEWLRPPECPPPPTDMGVKEGLGMGRHQWTDEEMANDAADALRERNLEQWREEMARNEEFRARWVRFQTEVVGS